MKRAKWLGFAGLSAVVTVSCLQELGCSTHFDDPTLNGLGVPVSTSGGTGGQGTDGGMPGSGGAGGAGEDGGAGGEEPCGNGKINVGEECDDSNDMGGDGCDSSCKQEKGRICEGEPSVCSTCIDEKEANDKLSEASVDLKDPTALAVCGSIKPQNDEDSFKLRLSNDSVVTLETFDVSGADCNDVTKTLIKIYTADLQGGSQSFQTSTEIESVGIKPCAAISLLLPKNADDSSYYIKLARALGSDPPGVFEYTLKARFPEVKALEKSDGDNNSIEGAEAIGKLDRGYYLLKGNLSGSTDGDHFSFSIPSNSSLRVEVVGDNPSSCVVLATKLVLMNDNGDKELASDADSGFGLCSLIDGTGATPLHEGAKNATEQPADYNLLVTRVAGTEPINYNVVVTVR